jgi:hypothetical protein
MDVEDDWPVNEGKTPIYTEDVRPHTHTQLNSDWGNNWGQDKLYIMSHSLNNKLPEYT